MRLWLYLYSVLAALLCVAPSARADAPPIPGFVQLHPQFVPEATVLGISFFYSTQSFGYEQSDAARTLVTGNAIGPWEAVAFARFVAAELRFYPRACIQRLQLRGVVLSTDLKTRGNHVDGIPDLTNGLLLYDVGLLRNRQRLPNFARYALDVIHHELYHLWDFRDDGLIGDDPAWTALNPAGFVYGTGGHNMRTIGTGEWSTRRYGALSEYATSGLEEDKAVTYAALMVRGDELDVRVRADAVIAAKVRLLKEQMAATCRAMGPAFWQTLEDHRLARLQAAQRAQAQAVRRTR